MPLQAFSRRTLFSTLILLIGLSATSSFAQSNGSHPWSNSSLSPDERASMVVKEMTIDEKINMLHGTGMVGLSPMSPLP